MKKCLTFLFIILLIGLVSCANVKEFDKSKGNYGKELIKDDKNKIISEYFLDINTDVCGLECSAEGHTILYKNDKLFENVKFKKLRNSKLEDYSITFKVLIKTSEKEVKIPEYSNDCSSGKCILMTNYKLIKVPVWEEYDGRQLKSGVYYWKLIGNKGLYETIDWRFLVTSYNIVLDDWALWRSDFSDDFEDSSINSDYWLNYSKLWDVACIGTPVYQTVESNGYLNIKSTAEASGGACSSATILRSKKDYNDGNLTRRIDFTINGSNPSCLVSGSLFLDIANNTYLNGTSPDPSWSSDTNGKTVYIINTIQSTDYYLILNKYNNTANLYNSTDDLISSVSIDPSFNWYYQLRSSVSTTSTSCDHEINIFSFNTQSSSYGFGSNLISPSNDSRLIPDVITFSSNHTSIDYNLINTTLKVWNSTGDYGTNYTTITGIYNETSLTYNITSYGTYYWNQYTCVGNSTYSVCQYEDNNTIILQRFKENSQTFSSSALSGSLQTFIINITAESSFTSARLSYNNTIYPANSIQSLGSGNYIISVNITVPIVDSLVSKNFYWELNFTGSLVNSSTNTQSINGFAIDNCSTYSTLLLNYTMFDELTKSLIQDNLTSFTKVNVLIYSSDYNNPVLNYSTINIMNNTQICINDDLLNQNYYMDVIAQYDGGDDYVVKYNNIQKKLLNSTTIPINVNLFNLPSSNSTEFKVTFKDGNFIKKSNVLIDVSRKYVEDGIFRTVEVAKTDTNGETIVHLQLSDTIYTLFFTYNGEILAILDSVIAKCQNPLYSECTIDVNSFSASSNIPDFNYINGISANMMFDKTTKTITTTFISESGTNSLVLNVTRFDRFGNQTVCSDSVTSSSGTLSCTVPDSFGNITIVSELFSNGELVISNIYLIGNDNPDNSGSTIILALMIVITLSMLFINDVRGILLGCFIGLILSGLLLFLNSGSLFSKGSAITWLLVAVVILIWKINKREES